MQVKFDDSTFSLEKVGFELGFDIYQASADYILPSLDSTDVMAGYNAAKKQGIRQHKGDRYERKWLSIRARCLLKDREVLITPHDLELALELTRGVCPVTGETLTFSTGELSDWSVDRIDNDMPYTADNIIILSSRANRAKGDLDLTDMLLSIGYYYQVDDPFKDRHDFLSMMQWYHMISVFYNRLPLDNSVNFSNEIAQRSPKTIITLMSKPLFSGNTSHHFNNHLITQNILAKDSLEKARKHFRKRFIRLCQTTGRQEDPVKVLSSTPKLLTMVEGIVDKVRNCHRLDKAFLLDLLGDHSNHKKPSKVAGFNHKITPTKPMAQR